MALLDSKKPFYDRKPGDVAVLLDIMDAEPLRPEQLGSRRYFLVNLAERFGALLQKSDLLRLRRYFCKRRLLLGATIEGFTDNCLCILCPTGPTGLAQLRSDIQSGLLEREFICCFVTDVALRKLSLKCLSLRIRVWPEELELAAEEWRNGLMPAEYDISGNEKSLLMLRCVRQFQLSRLQHPTAGALPRLRQIEAHFEANLTGLINYAKLLLGGGRLAPLESLSEFSELRANRPELVRCPDARYADEYLEALRHVGMTTDSIERGVLEPLGQIRVGGENSVQFGKRSEIDSLVSGIRELLSRTNPLKSVTHHALHGRISASERVLLGGLLSLLPCAVRLLADIDEALDSYFNAGGVHFRPADLGVTFE